MRSIFSILFFLTLVFGGCVKEDATNPEESCVDCLPFQLYDFNVCHPEGGLTSDPCDYFAKYDTLNVWGPVFNPNNSAEVGVMVNKQYISWSGSSSSCCRKFVIFNHRQNTIVMEHPIPDKYVPTSTPDWSVNDVLIFSTHENSQLHTLNLNTGAFSFVMYGSGPIWSPGGEHFLYTSGTFGNATAYLANTDGDILDTVGGLQPELTIADWFASNKVLYDWGNYYDFENDGVFSPKFPDELYLNVRYQKWGATDDEIAIISENSGLGIFNIRHGSFNLVKENQSGRYYGDLDFSNDNQYIASRVSRWFETGSDTLLIVSQLRVMDIGGSNEVILDITPY